MKQLVFRVGAFLLFGIIIAAAIITSLDDIGGSYSEILQSLEEEPVIRPGMAYYNKLTKKQQYIYDCIAKAADKLEHTTEKMPIVPEMDDITSAANALLADCPEYFYISVDGFSLEDYSYTEVVTDEETAVVTGSNVIDERYTALFIPYTETVEELKIKQSRLEAAISKAQSLTSGMEDELDIQTALHDYIVSICEKSQDGGMYNSNVYGALVEGQANAEGYHKAFKLLLNRAGIISHLAYGEVRGTRSVWCTVLINDKYYNTDVYEDDLDSEFDGQTVRGLITHAYMNLSDDAIGKTHKKTDPNSVKCTDNTTYYTAKQLVCTNEGMTEKLISAQLADFVKYKKKSMELYCEYDVSNDDIETFVFRQFELLYPEYTCECKVIKPKTEFDAYTLVIDYMPRAEESTI